METKAITRAVEKNGEIIMETNVITTRLHYNGKEHKEIRLADILSLA